MSLLERIRRFWLPGRGPDHPLSEEERKGVPQSAIEEVSSLAEGFVGAPFDTDANERPTR